MSLLIFHCGFKQAMIILARWPSYILLPMFSIYTFGAKTIGSRKYLVLSTNWTWVNLFLTLCGITFGSTFVYLQGTSDIVAYIFCFPLFFVGLFNAKPFDVRTEREALRRELAKILALQVLRNTAE